MVVKYGVVFKDKSVEIIWIFMLDIFCYIADFDLDCFLTLPTRVRRR